MAYPTTIKLFLVNGEPDGIRTAEILNWSGWAVACPRSDLSGLKARAELSAPGVYIHIFDKYVGEGKSVYGR